MEEFLLKTYKFAQVLQQLSLLPQLPKEMEEDKEIVTSLEKWVGWGPDAWSIEHYIRMTEY